MCFSKNCTLFVVRRTPRQTEDRAVLSELTFVFLREEKIAMPAETPRANMPEVDTERQYLFPMQ